MGLTRDNIVKFHQIQAFTRYLFNFEIKISVVYVEVGLVGNSPITITVVTSGSGFARQWRIKVTQNSCDSLSRGIK